MLRRGDAGRGARLPRAQLRGRRPDLRPRRADQPRVALLGRRAPAAVAPRRHRLAADQAAGPQGGQRPRRGAARAVREARGGAGLPVLARLAVADGDGGLVPVRGDPRPAPGGRRGQGRHGGAPADGPAGRRRRRLRQDGGRAAGRVQGDPGREAGRGPRPDDRASRAALHHVQPAVRGVPADGEAAVAVRVGEGAGGDGRGPGGRDGRHRHRHPPAAVQGRGVPGPRPGGGRRGAAVRGRGEGAAEAAAVAPSTCSRSPRRRSRGRSTWRSPGSGTSASSRPRRRIACRSRPGSPRRRPGLVRDAILRELDRGGQCLLRPQPRRDHRGAGRAAPAAAAGGADRRRARPDGRGRAREGHAHLRRRRGRRPRVHHDHRVRPRHPQRQHDRHRPRGHPRARAALPAAGSGRAVDHGARTPTCSTGGASG